MDAADATGVLTVLWAEREIRDVVLRYCRGIDRRDFDVVRACYHADAIDEHGDFVGGVDAFVAHARASLQAFETTTHFTGNILVDLDPDHPDRARCETSVIALHRLPARDGRGPRDHAVGLRYVDDFHQRDGAWRIAHRICVFDWTRTDPVVGWQFTEVFRRGRVDGTDVVFAPSLADATHHHTGYRGAAHEAGSSQPRTIPDPGAHT